MIKKLFLLLALGIASTGCGDSRDHAHAVYMLVDTSGTYAREADKAQVIINYLLGTLQPGDSLAVARVESRSFSEKDIVAKATFDTRPSQANAQKRAFRDKTRRWLEANTPSEDLKTLAERKAWHRRLYEAGYVGMLWPKEYGGWGATAMQQAISSCPSARI